MLHFNISVHSCWGIFYLQKQQQETKEHTLLFLQSCKREILIKTWWLHSPSLRISQSNCLIGLQLHQQDSYRSKKKKNHWISYWVEQLISCDLCTDACPLVHGWPPEMPLLHRTKLHLIKFTALIETSCSRAQIHRAKDQTHLQQKGCHQLAESGNSINLADHPNNMNAHAKHRFECCEWF